MFTTGCAEKKKITDLGRCNIIIPYQNTYRAEKSRDEQEVAGQVIIKSKHSRPYFLLLPIDSIIYNSRGPKINTFGFQIKSKDKIVCSPSYDPLRPLSNSSFLRSTRSITSPPLQKKSPTNLTIARISES